eukprot:5054659-Pleurochrysis_carterae.AAC.2
MVCHEQDAAATSTIFAPCMAMYAEARSHLGVYTACATVLGESVVRFREPISKVMPLTTI